MSTFKIGFIGSGKMATAIAAGIVNKDIFSPSEIMASDVSEVSLGGFKASCGGYTCTDNNRVVNECSTIVLAVKPQVAEAVCATLEIPAETHITWRHALNRLKNNPGMSYRAT